MLVGPLSEEVEILADGVDVSPHGHRGRLAVPRPQGPENGAVFVERVAIPSGRERERQRIDHVHQARHDRAELPVACCVEDETVELSPQLGAAAHVVFGRIGDVERVELLVELRQVALVELRRGYPGGVALEQRAHLADVDDVRDRRLGDQDAALRNAAHQVLVLEPGHRLAHRRPAHPQPTRELLLADQRAWSEARRGDVALDGLVGARGQRHAARIASAGGPRLRARRPVHGSYLYRIHARASRTPASARSIGELGQDEAGAGRDRRRGQRPRERKSWSAAVVEGNASSSHGMSDGAIHSTRSFSWQTASVPPVTRASYTMMTTGAAAYE